jgi:adenylate cyclase
VTADPDLAEIATRAGVDAPYVARLVELGIVPAQTSPDGAVRRVKVAVAIEQGGIPLELLGSAIRDGHFSLDFVEQPSYDVLAAYSGETFGDVAARTGIPLEALLAIRRAMGFADAEPDDRMRRDELEVVPLLAFQLAAGVRRPLMERALAVQGEALRRIADTEADWWRTEILEPHIRSGRTARDIGSLTEELAAQMSPAADRALVAIYHGQEAHAWMRNIFEGFESLLDRAGVRPRTERVPAICFLDLTGYTRLTEQQGDAAAADAARRLGALVERTSARHGGRAVKWLGDGVMFHFDDPAGAVLAAISMVDGAAGEGLPPAHVGIHAGPVLFDGGDYFGRTVNLASRIADYARAGEVLVTQEVVDRVALDEVAFTAVGPIELKGVGTAVILHLARRAIEPPPSAKG